MTREPRVARVADDRVLLDPRAVPPDHVARVADDRVLLDPRAVPPERDAALADAIAAAMS